MKTVDTFSATIFYFRSVYLPDLAKSPLSFQQNEKAGTVTSIFIIFIDKEVCCPNVLDATAKLVFWTKL